MLLMIHNRAAGSQIAVSGKEAYIAATWAKRGGHRYVSSAAIQKGRDCSSAWTDFQSLPEVLSRSGRVGCRRVLPAQDVPHTVMGLAATALALVWALA